MRLIDADKLIEKLRDFKEWENDDGRPIHTMSETQRIDRCINFVQMEPTAYDVDKVVEELETNKQNALEVEESIKEYNVWNEAIEIVKQGCASDDDVCEWKLDGDMAINPHTFIKYKIKQYDSLYALDTCQYCRKKIKVVGD